MKTTKKNKTKTKWQTPLMLMPLTFYLLSLLIPPFLLLLLLHMGELNHFPYTATTAAAAAPVTKTGTINNKQRHDERVP